MNVFVVQLVDAGHHALVPLYAVHLRSTLREPLYTAFLGKLTAEPPERKVDILDQVCAGRSIALGTLGLLTKGANDQGVRTCCVSVRDAKETSTIV